MRNSFENASHHLFLDKYGQPTDVGDFCRIDWPQNEEMHGLSGEISTVTFEGELEAQVTLEVGPDDRYVKVHVSKLVLINQADIVPITTKENDHDTPGPIAAAMERAKQLKELKNRKTSSCLSGSNPTPSRT